MVVTLNVSAEGEINGEINLWLCGASVARTSIKHPRHFTDISGTIKDLLVET